VTANDHDRRLREVEQANAAIRQQATTHNEQIRQLLGLLELYARMDERFAGLATDVHEAHEGVRAINERIVTLSDHFDERLDTEREERRKGQDERKVELEDAVADREKQFKALRLEYTKLMVGIGSIFLTSLGGVIVAWLAQRGGK
jgi:chromosome segregation ATPase